MGLPVVTVASGGLPVSAVAFGLGLPVLEAINLRGIPVTRVALGGLPVVFVGEEGGVVEASLAFQDSDISSATSASYTLSGLTSVAAIGQERFVAVGYIAAPPTDHITALTIDGQTATLVLRAQGDTDGGGAAPSTEIWRAPGTAATSVNVAITLNNAVFSTRCALYVGTDVGTVLDSDTSALDGAAAPRTDDLSVDTVDGGAVLASAMAYSGSGIGTVSTAWAGVTEDLDGIGAYGNDVFSSASVSNTSAATPRDVDVTWTNIAVSGSSALGAVCVSFAPVAVERAAGAVPPEPEPPPPMVVFDPGDGRAVTPPITGFSDGDLLDLGFDWEDEEPKAAPLPPLPPPTLHYECDRSFGERHTPQWAWLKIRDYTPIRRAQMMLRARWQALKHIRLMFPRRGCRIWRVYSHLGIKTHQVFCECGREFH